MNSTPESTSARQDVEEIFVEAGGGGHSPRRSKSPGISERRYFGNGRPDKDHDCWASSHIIASRSAAVVEPRRFAPGVEPRSWLVIGHVRRALARANRSSRAVFITSFYSRFASSWIGAAGSFGWIGSPVTRAAFPNKEQTVVRAQSRCRGLSPIHERAVVDEVALALRRQALGVQPVEGVVDRAAVEPGLPGTENGRDVVDVDRVREGRVVHGGVRDRIRRGYLDVVFVE